MRATRLVVVLGGMLGLLGGAASGQVIFADQFTGGASAMWSNYRGNWIASGGEYFAQAPNNNPITITTVPFVLTDFMAEVDVRAVSDGGIWIHSDGVANNGVLLVTGGSGHSGRGFYWHTVTNGGFSPALAPTGALFNQGDNIHVTVNVTGSVYEVYMNGSAEPVALLNAGGFPQGLFGLYDFTSPGQRFDNVEVRCLGLVVPLTAQSTCPGGGGEFNVRAGGLGPFTFGWEYAIAGDEPRVYRPLLQGENAPDGDVLFTATVTRASRDARVVIDGYRRKSDLILRCNLGGACGSGQFEAPLRVCLGEYNCDGGIDGGDVSAFFADWEAGLSAADMNEDGGVDGADVQVFFAKWEAGC